MTTIPPETVALHPSFTAEDFDRLSEAGRAVVGHAFRYVALLGGQMEQGGHLPPVFEDSRQRAAWRTAAAEVPRHELRTVSGMLADAMEAVRVLRSTGTRHRKAVPATEPT